MLAVNRKVIDDGSSKNQTIDNSSSELILLKEEVEFQRALRDTNALLKAHGCSGKSAFISYAWEDESTEEGRHSNSKLQEWLRRISKDLETVGINVFLDIEGIKGNLKDWMTSGIAQSDYILLIGTPRYKMRSTQETNVAHEFNAIMKKISDSQSKSILIPLLYSGGFSESFPPGVMEHLIRDFRETQNYYQYLMGLVKPLGVIPNMYPELEKTGSYHQEYSWLFELFMNKKTMLESQLKQMSKLQQEKLIVVADELPVSSPFFVGRTNEMLTIDQEFNKKGLVIVAVQAMGGAGKSQLAAEYAHKTKNSESPYDLVRWIKADSKDSLKNSYFRLGDDLGIEREEYKDSEEELKNAIQSQLLRYKRVLLIYDNVESYDDVSGYIPSSGSGTFLHVILTTRIRFSEHFTITVPEFTAEEVQDYLNKRLKTDVSLAIATQFGKELGYLPLAIVQSASYMIKFAKSPEAFLKLMQTDTRYKVLDGDVKQKTVSSLWNLTLDRLSQDSLEIIRLCAYLDPDNIPQPLLNNILGDEKADEVLYDLRSQSLISESGGGMEVYRIHRLLQEAIKRQLSKIDASKAVVTKIIENCVNTMQIMLDENQNKSSTQVYLFWKNNEPLAIQIGRLLQISDGVGLNDKCISLLLEWRGEYYSLVSLDYKESLRLYSLAFEKINKSDDLNRKANILGSLARVYDQQGVYDKAFESLQDLLKILKKIYGEQDIRIADCLMNIGSVYRAQGNYDEALKYYGDSLSMRKVVRGGELFADVAENLRNIGLIYKAQGNYKDAYEYLEKSLDIRRKVYGENHPDVAESLNGLGLIYKADGKYDIALKYFEQALSIRKSVFGENHHRVAISVNCIGTVYEAQGNYDLALQYFEQALTIRKSIYGDNHQSVARTLIGIANVYKAQNKLDDALSYFNKSLAIQSATYGDKSSRLVDSLKGIGDIFASKGDLANATQHYERCLLILKLSYPNNDKHPEIVKIQKKLQGIQNKPNEPVVFSRSTQSSVPSESHVEAKKVSHSKCIVS